MELKVGDKVKYINKENLWFGKIGKVISVYVGTCFINFDDKIVECYKKNLEKIEDKQEEKQEPFELKEGMKFKAKQEKYIVWNPKGNNPKRIHTSIDEAEKEAERLANSNPNQEFYVLKAISKAKGTVKVEWE